MKYTIILLSLLFSFCDINAQNENLIQRAKSGDLTLEECRDSTLHEQNVDLFPSLLKLKDKLEKDNIFNCNDYIYIINLLSAYYSNRGEYYSISLLLDEAFEIINKHELSTNNKYLRNLWTVRGKIEAILNNYDSALEYMMHTLHMCEEANDFSFAYFLTTSNIAYLYLAKGEILQAKLFMDEAIETLKKLQGDIFEINQEEVYTFFNQYGMIYDAVKDYNNAEKYYRHVIENCKQTQMSADAYKLACNNLACMLMKQNKWEESLQYMLMIRYSNNTDNNYMFFQNLAINYLFLFDYINAIEQARRMNNVAYSNIGYIFSHFTEIEKENYWSMKSKELLFLDNLIAYRSMDSDARKMAYNNIINSRNLQMTNAKLISECVSQSKDDNLKNEYALYKKLRGQLAFKTTKEKRDSLRALVKEYERNVINSIDNIGELLKDKLGTWEDIRDVLDENEYAIEFTHIPLMDTYPIVEAHYGAYIIAKEYESPRIVLLDIVDSVENVIVNDNPDELFINNLYNRKINRTVYNMIWKTIKPYLKDNCTVYYSPTSFLSYLNMEVLEDEEGNRLADLYKMRRVSSTARIGEIKKRGKEKYKSAVVYGNIKYDESQENMVAESEKYDSFTGVEIVNEMVLRSMNDRGKWGNIPATKDEIYEVAKSLKRKNANVVIKELSAASEESFKILSGCSPDIIHLATHGFVIDTPDKALNNKFVASTNIYSPKEAYMMWTGLLMAGANNVWTGQFDVNNVEDGILTAEEISQLDLSNTKLVVMSACETGRGKVDPIDGVLGLQRAFKKAGVKSIVMSLWKVNDEATSLMMSCFYRHLTNGKERHEALELARKDVVKEYPDPFYWAGFIMLD